MRYRRARTPGVTYFFTVITYQRQKIFHHAEAVELLRQVFRHVKQNHPFNIDAMVVLPDHLHSLWTLPPDDAKFSTRWRLIKSEFTRLCPESYKQQCSLSRLSKGEQAVWQRRFWEHQIRDETDFIHHIEYIHYNPVHHRLVKAPKDWAYSSFHHYVRDGIYEADWGAEEAITFGVDVGRE
ncbi:MAG: transposase [Coleofasciculus sp. G3-WIS-01]|uniref:REP-associated tyrosine transposase n=1 Tax=Coleofasciculus sp. G3-WIS-01 TaxID=3069528 RepID=UPI0032F93E47